jgi:hypothetical protein
VVPVSSATALAGANPTARLEIHPEADHRFASAVWQAWLVDRVDAFLAEHL